MFSTTQADAVVTPAHKCAFVHIGCGVDFSMKPGPIQTYSQSTAPTTTATVLYL